MSDVERKQKPTVAKLDPQRKGFVPRPAPADPLRPAGGLATETGARGTYMPVCLRRDAELHDKEERL